MVPRSRTPGERRTPNDANWEPPQLKRVYEVKYDYIQGDRFRHAAVFQLWRPDKPPRECRYDQLEIPTPYELERVLGARS